jgi:hypothetical protein
MIIYFTTNFFSMATKCSSRTKIRNSGLRIRGSGSEREIYGSRTLLFFTVPEMLNFHPAEVKGKKGQFKGTV